MRVPARKMTGPEAGTANLKLEADDIWWLCALSRHGEKSTRRNTLHALWEAAIPWRHVTVREVTGSVRY